MVNPCQIQVFFIISTGRHVHTLFPVHDALHNADRRLMQWLSLRAILFPIEASVEI